MACLLAFRFAFIRGSQCGSTFKSPRALVHRAWVSSPHSLMYSSCRVMVTCSQGEGHFLGHHPLQIQRDHLEMQSCSQSSHLPPELSPFLQPPCLLPLRGCLVQSPAIPRRHKTHCLSPPFAAVGTLAWNALSSACWCPHLHTLRSLSDPTGKASPLLVPAPSHLSVPPRDLRPNIICCFSTCTLSALARDGGKNAALRSAADLKVRLASLPSGFVTLCNSSSSPLPFRVVLCVRGHAKLLTQQRKVLTGAQYRC